MDEIKTNPPVQNTPAEPPKKVRRVGTMAFALLLIAGGALLLVQQFMPKANLLSVLKFSPVILIVLGIEVLVYSTKPDVKLKFDWLGILGCAFILVTVGTASLMPMAYRWLGVDNRYAENRIEQQVVDSMYQQLSANPELKAEITSMYASAYFNHTDMENTDYTLEPGDTLILHLNFRQDAAGSEQEFAANCAAIVQAAKEAGWNFTTMNFGTEENVGGVYDTYRAEFSQSFADGLTIEQLAKRVQKGYYYDYDCYDSEEARDNAIKADLRDQISERYADENDDVYPDADYLTEETERQFNALYGSRSSEIVTPESAA
jgi:hypothetical protein